SAVVIGSVYYGSRPTVIQGRVSRYSYGVECSRPYDPSKHSALTDSVVTDPVTGKQMVLGMFSRFVSLGQKIPVGHSVTRTYSPQTPSQRHVQFQLHLADRKAVMVADKGVERLGNVVKVALPHSGNRSVRVTMQFGGTEIRMDIEPLNPSVAKRSVTVQFNTHEGDLFEEETQPGPWAQTEIGGEGEREREVETVAERPSAVSRPTPPVPESVSVASPAAHIYVPAPLSTGGEAGAEVVAEGGRGLYTGASGAVVSCDDIPVMHQKTQPQGAAAGREEGSEDETSESEASDSDQFDYQEEDEEDEGDAWWAEWKS
ncbi:hypothetical protein KIPB_012645, partial [Kipferlia bialata]